MVDLFLTNEKERTPSVYQVSPAAVLLDRQMVRVDHGGYPPPRGEGPSGAQLGFQSRASARNG